MKKLKQQETSIKKYITELEDYVKDYDKELVIAGILSIKFGNTMEMLYAGMNEDFKKFYPQYKLYPRVFEDAYNDNIIWANMGGVEGSLDDGLTKFKSNFAPHIEEFIGEFNIPVNKVLYRVSNFVYELRKKLRKQTLKHWQIISSFCQRAIFCLTFLRVDHLAGGLLFN